MPDSQETRAGTQAWALSYRRERDLPRLLAPPLVPPHQPVPPDYSLRLLRRLFRQWRNMRHDPLPVARHRAVSARIAFKGELAAIRRALAPDDLAPDLTPTTKPGPT